jgi:hypothetical protein
MVAFCGGESSTVTLRRGFGKVQWGSVAAKWSAVAAMGEVL